MLCVSLRCSAAWCGLICSFNPWLWFRHNQSVETQLHVCVCVCVSLQVCDLIVFPCVWERIVCPVLCVSVWRTCACMAIYSVYGWVCADILCNNIADKSRINCQSLAPWMLLFLQILWQSSSWRCNLAFSRFGERHEASLLAPMSSASLGGDITIFSTFWTRNLRLA